MRKTILISNDDGYFSSGIEALICAFKEKYDVFVVAPQVEQSGKSHSFTFGMSLTYKKIEREDDVPCFSVNGSPADCVKVALAHLMPKKPDFVISGINGGENIGIAVFLFGDLRGGAGGGVLEDSRSRVFASLSAKRKYKKLRKIVV